MSDDTDRGLDPLSQRLKELQEDPDRTADDEMVEPVSCRWCSEEHLGEVYTSPPDGWYIRYWCPEAERRHRKSAF